MLAASLDKNKKSKRCLNAKGSKDKDKLYICSLENIVLTNPG